MKLHVLALGVALATLLPACSMTVNAVNPRPNVVVSNHAGALALDASQVPDDFVIERITIHEFKKSLSNGFKNAVGDNLASNDKGAVKLIITSVQMELANMPPLGRFLNIRYRAKWAAPDGTTVAQVAGVARPRNPLEPGPRHVEDAVEVMMENMIDGLDKATRRDSTGRAPIGLVNH